MKRKSELECLPTPECCADRPWRATLYYVGACTLVAVLVFLFAGCDVVDEDAGTAPIAPTDICIEGTAAICNCRSDGDNPCTEGEILSLVETCGKLVQCSADFADFDGQTFACEDRAAACEGEQL